MKMFVIEVDGGPTPTVPPRLRPDWEWVTGTVDGSTEPEDLQSREVTDVGRVSLPVPGL